MKRYLLHWAIAALSYGAFLHYAMRYADKYCRPLADQLTPSDECGWTLWAMMIGYVIAIIIAAWGARTLLATLVLSLTSVLAAAAFAVPYDHWSGPIVWLNVLPALVLACVVESLSGKLACAKCAAEVNRVREDRGGDKSAWSARDVPLFLVLLLVCGLLLFISRTSGGVAVVLTAAFYFALWNRRTSVYKCAGCSAKWKFREARAAGRKGQTNE